MPGHGKTWISSLLTRYVFVFICQEDSNQNIYYNTSSEDNSPLITLLLIAQRATEHDFHATLPILGVKCDFILSVCSSSYPMQQQRPPTDRKTFKVCLFYNPQCIQPLHHALGGNNASKGPQGFKAHFSLSQDLENADFVELTKFHWPY